ncbi:inverse autotransporter beta domain-containing protein [Blastopirellula marina]|uniref:Inverse autotransporter beta-domain domain-containing protein n=1 Tax=Blastopirellula marina TaxID=124 RepID=A0A2S8G8Q3_9BACT|nr:inverse autotransporter beta domain-containing protein [Blastopirellula marina]PQO40842.1 hypothetical protein C5Y98_04495 [Blastopirellula marina]PTL45724.1 hypothetical protein C5Y97_04495 [Blastopirellula marina]
MRRLFYIPLLRMFCQWGRHFFWLSAACVAWANPSHANAQVPMTVYSNSEPLYRPYVAGRLAAGNQRTLGDGRLFLPLAQTSNSLLFADIRAQLDDSQNYEGNWGLGGRFLREDGWIYGGYGYYDSRWTTHGNQFNQMTLGIEAMSVMYEVRMNGYLPDTNVHYFEGSGGTGPATATLVGNQLFVVTPGNQFEVAYYGADVEAGALLMSWGENQDIEWRGFAGAYHFDSDEAEAITGPRLRTELRLFDLKSLGEGSRVTLGAEYQWDEVRDDQYFLSANVRIPFGPGSRKLNPLQRRMVDRVVRDVDIVSNVGGSQTKMEEAVYADTGDQIGEVTTVTGSDAEEMINAASADQLIIVQGKAGDYSHLVTPAAGVHLLGGGGAMTVKGKQSGTVAQYTAPGDAPELNANIKITNDNVTIEHLTQNGTIDIEDAQHVTIDNTTAGRVYIDGKDNSVLISSSHITATGFDNGVRMNAGELTIRDSVIESPGSNGINLFANSNSEQLTLNLQNSRIVAKQGFFINADSVSSSNLTIVDNYIEGKNWGVLFGGSSGDHHVTMHGNTLIGPDPVYTGSATVRIEQASLDAFASDNGVKASDFNLGKGMFFFDNPPAALPLWP